MVSRQGGVGVGRGGDVRLTASVIELTSIWRYSVRCESPHDGNVASTSIAAASGAGGLCVCV